MRNNLPNISITMATKMTLPASQKPNSREWHNPANSKLPKNHIPQLQSNRAMKEKMLNSFTITLAHITPIQNANLSIVRHFPKTTVQTKKATLEGIFCFQMLFQGKN